MMRYRNNVIKIKNKNGFTLIELLTVIVILGILMMVAIPAISRMIENFRKDSLITISKEYVKAVKVSWLSGDLLCGSSNQVSSDMDEGNYYVLIDTTSETMKELLEQVAKSPWGNRDLKGYVRVNITRNSKEEKVIKYYVALADGIHGIYDDTTSPIEVDDLKSGDIIMNLTLAANEEKRKAIMETPFDTGKVTTCSTLYGNWDGSGETVSFADDSWDTIVSAVKEGNIENYHVGDTKEVDMGTFGTHTLRIANTSTPAECSTPGFSQTACGFVLEFVDIIIDHKMNSANNNVGGWPATPMRTYVNNDIYNALPAELKNGIIDTFVVSGHGPTQSSNFTSTDKLYLLSPIEVNKSALDTAQSNTRILDFYQGKDNTDRIKNLNGTAIFWWLRAAVSNNSHCFSSVHISGTLNYNNAVDVLGVAPAFRIG